MLPYLPSARPIDEIADELTKLWRESDEMMARIAVLVEEMKAALIAERIARN